MDAINGSPDPVAAVAHSLLGKDAGDFGLEELQSVVMLAAAREKLVSDGDRLDTRSEKGRTGCKRFLRRLEKLAVALSVERAPREYRGKFTANFRALFAGEDRSYRVDILEAALSLMPAVWANGEAYQLGEEAMSRALGLRQAWAALGELFDGWASPEHEPGQARREMCERLERLDVAWASFEEAYVDELLLVQRRARSVLADAIKQEQRLRFAECASTGGARRVEIAAWCEHRQEEVALLEHMGRLVAAAGASPKPSTQVLEVSMQIFDDAMQVLAITGSSKAAPQRWPDPTVVLATRAAESYNSLRDYLVRVRKHLDKVHPQLCKNPGLSERLARWQESWERSALYAQNPDFLEGARHLVDFVAETPKIVPGLQGMFEDCDAELFLVLPRLVCLSLLSDPAGPVAPLLRRLLPSRFAAPGARTDGPGRAPSGTLSGPVLETSSALNTVLQLLVAGVQQGGGEGAEAAAWSDAWEVLVRRAVAGAGAEEAAPGLYAKVQPGWRRTVAAAVEGLMHDVEGWSMELQRHNPEAWNDLSDLLVQCMVWKTGKVEEQRAETLVI